MRINLSDIESNRLIGYRAHHHMSPKCRIHLLDRLSSKNIRHSSVLLLLFNQKEETHLIFIKRAHSSGIHSRQISFPGGAFEKTDKNMKETAIRECREEIGIRAPIQIIRKLSDLYIPPSNFLVHPFVGFIDKQPERFIPNPTEVDQIFTENVLNFLKPEFKDTYHYHHDGKPCSTPCFISNGYAIWGATAMILNEFLSLFPKNFINLHKTNIV